MSKKVDLLPYRTEKLTKEMIDLARRELGETDEMRKNCLTQVRAYIKEQKNLKCTDDDIFFLQFLRKSKFDINKTIKLLQAYFKEKKNFPEIFSTPNLPALRKCLGTKLASFMPYRDKDGSAVVVYRADKWDLDEFSFADAVHFMAVMLLAAVEFEPTQVCGIKIILSTKGVTLRHIIHIQLKYLYLVARGVKSCLPTRIKGIHVLHENVHVRLLWNIVSIYVGQKIRSRLHFHGTEYASLQKYINPAVIPKDFGGQLDDDPAFGLKLADDMKHIYIKRLLDTGYY